MKTTVQINTSSLNKIKEPGCFWLAPKTEILSTVEDFLNRNREEQAVSTARLIHCLLDNDTVKLKNLRRQIQTKLFDASTKAASIYASRKENDKRLRYTDWLYKIQKQPGIIPDCFRICCIVYLLRREPPHPSTLRVAL